MEVLLILFQSIMLLSRGGESSVLQAVIENNDRTSDKKIIFFIRVLLKSKGIYIPLSREYLKIILLLETEVNPLMAVVAS